MPHSVNRNAFLAARNCGHLLLSAYGLLVAVELGLKDHARSWVKGHDVPQMLTELGNELGDAGLTALGAGLKSKLEAIPCTDPSGNPASVLGNNYPGLRYTHHISDYGGGTSDANLQCLVEEVEDIILQLRAKGVSI